MKEEHILLSTDGPDCNVLKLKPPMIFTKQNVDEFISTLDRILKEIRNNEPVTPSQKSTVVSGKQRDTRTHTPITKEEKIKSI